ncbi:conserved hypothetical protein [Candidatus Desulfarcum epimagneticum]|uniref:Uncharacterized protein n=1 Tax=uncultured Desulfobacteraceae bacterium TaxID=218296 RepID=A0A484HJA1_9BACT|nr:conserved hypothetical protein [uncultured Desulfobacteraceae bacterium]
MTEPHEKIIEPVILTKIKGPPKEGIIKVSLEQYGVFLDPNVEYEWFAAIVPDEKERSADFFGSAVIRYEKPSKEFLEKISAAPKERRQFLYAENGYFYDAVEIVSDLINAGKNPKKFRSHRAALADQVKLPFAAGHDRKMAGK